LYNRQSSRSTIRTQRVLVQWSHHVDTNQTKKHNDEIHYRTHSRSSRFLVTLLCYAMLNYAIIDIDKGLSRSGETWRKRLWHANQDGKWANRYGMWEIWRLYLHICIICNLHYVPCQWCNQPDFAIWLEKIKKKGTKKMKREIVERVSKKDIEFERASQVPITPLYGVSISEKARNEFVENHAIANIWRYRVTHYDNIW